MAHRWIRIGLVILGLITAGEAVQLRAQEVRTEVVRMGNFTVDPPEEYRTEKAPIDQRGWLYIDQDKTDGMFFVFEFPGDDPALITQKMKASVIQRYLAGQPEPLTWNTSTLPAHPAMEKETAALYSLTAAGVEVQLAEYAMTAGQIRIHYGYFAMRHTKKAKKDAAFLDSSGNGQPKFEKFWRSITMEN